MVHVKKCPLGRGRRSRPTTEFYINGKPQIYCMGWINMMTDDPLENCKNCKDFVHGEQLEIDWEQAKQSGTLGKGKG